MHEAADLAQAAIAAGANAYLSKKSSSRELIATILNGAGSPLQGAADVREENAAKMPDQRDVPSAHNYVLTSRDAHAIQNSLVGIKNTFRLVRDVVAKDSREYHSLNLAEGELDRVAEILRCIRKPHRPSEAVPADAPTEHAQRIQGAIRGEHFTGERVRALIADDDLLFRNSLADFVSKAP